MNLQSGETLQDIRLEEGRARVGAQTVGYVSERDAEGLSAIVVEGRRVRVRTLRRGDRVLVWCGGRVFEFARAGSLRRREDHASEMTAPMPGKIRSVAVEEGHPVAKGDVVLVLEAMKMEHAIRAPRDGVVRLSRAPGDLVEAGERLAEIEEP